MHFISFYYTIFILGILHLIKLLYLEIITDLHAVVRNDENRFCTPHNFSHRQHLAKLANDSTTKRLTLIHLRYRSITTHVPRLALQQTHSLPFCIKPLPNPGKRQSLLPCYCLVISGMLHKWDHTCVDQFSFFSIILWRFIQAGCVSLECSLHF